MEQGKTGTTEDQDTSAMQEAAQGSKAAGDAAAKHIGDTLKSAAQHVRSQLPENGIAGQVADTLTSGIDQAATHLQEQGFGGMIDDVVAIARRYPMQAIFLGLGCGYLLSRLHRD